ncbi:MAG: NUDIX domain-containing protein [Candidatus Woesearchaeota archaeon]|jgi:8-oxo-dGTP pyrophosphatase MutT (NUDIX family)|nr:NUDIX domain-containing protein [Candidatus Woesearchaeota archaeon]
MKRRYTTGIVITNSKKEYLLHLRDNIPGIWSPGQWSIFSGGYETEDGPTNKIETFVKTAQREIKEEIGLELILKIFHHDLITSRNVSRYLLHGNYDGEISKIELKEGQKIQFFPYNKLPIENIPSSILKIIIMHNNNYNNEIKK